MFLRRQFKDESNTRKLPDNVRSSIPWLKSQILINESSEAVAKRVSEGAKLDVRIGKRKRYKREHVNAIRIAVKRRGHEHQIAAHQHHLL